MVGFESHKIFYYCATLGPSLLNILQSVIIGRVIVRTINVICFGTLRLDYIDVIFSLEGNLISLSLHHGPQHLGNFPRHTFRATYRPTYNSRATQGYSSLFPTKDPLI